ncbi:diaminobutyrate--2-oxoglutarate transaminase [Embleya sp. NPDC005575]|uniref:diaminobutyrate--2-oxoglutarate transaminase n=1 Tax=Embleya sp. NPDC005575 TaxID=3156892 RepID=UPI0033ABB9D2
MTLALDQRQGLVESEVRYYARKWPATFTRAAGPFMYAADGRRFIDFFSAAGSLNYGHNHPVLVDRMIELLAQERVLQGLDMATPERAAFLEIFGRNVTSRIPGSWRVQFTGPTGASAVEAALHLARKTTGRSNVVSFTNAFHGMSLGAASVSGRSRAHGRIGVESTVLPFDGYFPSGPTAVEMLQRYLDDPSSGLAPPAAIIVEAVQAEGGVRVAGDRWLADLALLAQARGIPLILDDIQAGCGRSGAFFSFERSGIAPDLVCLSKSLSGSGLPMSVLLIREGLDAWEPGEHSGTFRGQGLALATASAAVEHFWGDDKLELGVAEKEQVIRDHLERIADELAAVTGSRGRGMLHGLECQDQESADAVVHECFTRGLIVETAGALGNVVKLLPALTIDEDVLAEGLGILGAAARDVLAGGRR